MARFDVLANVDFRAHVKNPSLKVPGGRIVFDVYKGTGRVRFVPARLPRNYWTVLKPWSLWLMAMHRAWNCSPPSVREQFERARSAFPDMTARDLFCSVCSGRLFGEIETEDGVVYRPIWMKQYLTK